MTTHRIFVTTDLVAGQSFAPCKEHAHYLRNVLRLKTGDALRLFNGRDGEYEGRVAALDKRKLDIAVGKQLRAQPTAPDLWLCCAPIKKAHFEYMIEKATELGVSVIQPVLTARTQIREVNTERAHLIATEAAEQSERMEVPGIHAPIALDRLAALVKNRKLIVCAEVGEAQPAGEAFAALHSGKTPPAAILTGPEGGFADDEFTALRQIPGAQFVRLGPRILRADTAAIAALSCWQALAGDWL